MGQLFVGQCHGQMDLFVPTGSSVYTTVLVMYSSNNSVINYFAKPYKSLADLLMTVSVSQVVVVFFFLKLHHQRRGGYKLAHSNIKIIVLVMILVWRYILL